MRLQVRGGSMRAARPRDRVAGPDPHVDGDRRGVARGGGGRGRDQRQRPSIDVYRSTGPGGQSVNTTDSAVRITHLPTGIVVTMQDESRSSRTAKALRVLRARIYEAERERQQAGLSATRKSQIGSGERAKKIRTYNYPDSRATDHRVKVTLNLEKVLPGGLDDFTEALQAEDRRRDARLVSTAALRASVTSSGAHRSTSARPPRPAAWTRLPASRIRFGVGRDRGSTLRLRPAAEHRRARRLSRGRWRSGHGTSRSPTSWASGASVG